MIQQSDPPLPHLPGLAGRRINWARRDKISGEPLLRIFDWWHSAAGDGPPDRAAFDITAFGNIANHLYIIAEIDRGFELRLAGEEYIRLFGLKKGWVWEKAASDPVMRDSAVLMACIAQHQQPLHTIGRLELIERHWIELEALICPLALDADGRARFLGCTAAIA